MHFTRRTAKFISKIFILTVIMGFIISCDQKAIEPASIENTWQIHRYQILNNHSRTWISDSFDKTGVYRNYDSMGTLQFNGDQSAIYTYDSLSIPFTWETTSSESYEDEDVIQHYLHMHLGDTLTGNANRLPLIKNNLKYGVKKFRIISMEPEFMYLRYRSGFNDMSFPNDTLKMVDIYLKKR